MSFLTIFVRPPGDLIYYVLIVAVVMACVLMAAGHHIRRGTRATARLTLGLGAAFAAWLLLMGGALVSVLGAGGEFSSLQALERAANLLMLIALGWAFLTADTEVWDRGAGRTVFILAVGVLALVVLTGGHINAGLTGAPTAVVLIWLVAPIVLLGAGVAFAVVNRAAINDAPLKLVFAAILLSGYTAGLVQYVQNDSDSALGSVRLAFAAAMGVTAMIVYRALMAALIVQLRSAEQIAPRPPVAQPASPIGDRPASQPAPRAQSIGERESMQLLRALGLMIEDTKPTAVPLQIVRAALEMVRADIGALIRVQDANYADIVIGFDRTRRRIMNGLALNLNDQPTLQNALERQQQRPLFPDRNQAELDDLYTRLGVDKTGPAYFQPLARDGQLSGVLMVGFPFSDRELTEAETEAFKGLGVIAAGLLSLSDSAEDMRLLAEERAIQAMVQGVPLSTLTDEQVIQARQSALVELQKSRADIDMLTDQVRLMHERLLRERERLAMTLGDTDADMSISQRIHALSQQQLSLRDERNQLADRLRQMESALSGAASEGDAAAIQSLLTSLQAERDDLMAQRQRLEAQLNELRTTGLKPSRAAAAATVESMGAEQTYLEADRDQLRRRFEQMQAELAKFGVDGSPSGIAQLISQLYGERASLMARITTLVAEKDTLAQDRSKLNQRLTQLRDSEVQIGQLQREINNLAADREAIAKQRDAVKAQRDELVSRFEAVKRFRERVVERITMLESQLKSTQERYAELAASGGQVSGAVDGGHPMLVELSKATSRIIELERELAVLREASEGGAPRRMSAQETDMLVGLVQELRTPITSMRGYVDLMLKESAGILGDMQRKFLQRVAINVTRLSNMIEDLVRVAALDAGRVQLDRAAVDLVAVIEEAVTEVTTALREKGIEIDLALEDGVPAVTGDADALKQVALQLLTNAYLIAPPQSVLRVAVSRASENGAGPAGALLEIEDHGGGIAEEDLDSVFLRRFSGENPLVPGLGDTGVGLAIAKALVELQGGRIWVESQPGDGTRFSVLLSAQAS